MKETLLCSGASKWTQVNFPERPCVEALNGSASKDDHSVSARYSRESVLRAPPLFPPPKDDVYLTRGHDLLSS